MGKTGIQVAWQVGDMHVTWGVKLLYLFMSIFLCYPSFWLPSPSPLALARVLQRGTTPVPSPPLSSDIVTTLFWLLPH